MGFSDSSRSVRFAGVVLAFFAVVGVFSLFNGSWTANRPVPVFEDDTPRAMHQQTPLSYQGDSADTEAPAKHANSQAPLNTPFTVLPFQTNCSYVPPHRNKFPFDYDIMADTPVSFNLPVTDWEWKRSSQYGEDGIIDRLNKFLGQEFDGKYIEFGVEGGERECNTLHLRREKRWSGLLMDGQPENMAINKRQAMIFPHNICELFRKFNAPKRSNILSVDTDLKDYWLLKAILECGYSADMVITELNSILWGPMVRGTYRRDGGLDMWDMSSCCGMSLQAASLLMHKYGYTLIYVESNGLNAFFINNDRLKGRCVRDSDLTIRTGIMWRRPTYPIHPDRVCVEPEIVFDPPY